MAKIEIRIPDWLDRIFAWPVIWYRKRRYGDSFRRIPLGEGKFTLVSPKDFYWLSNFHWSTGGRGEAFYAARLGRTEKGRTRIVYLHREIIKPRKGLLVDHKNGYSLDNRRANLRIATRSQNLRNRGKVRRKTSSQYIGVYYRKSRKRWAVQIDYRGKTRYIGSFKDEIEAAKARDKAARKYHGEFARLNFAE